MHHTHIFGKLTQHPHINVEQENIVCVSHSQFARVALRKILLCYEFLAISSYVYKYTFFRCMMHIWWNIFLRYILEYSNVAQSIWVSQFATWMSTDKLVFDFPNILQAYFSNIYVLQTYVLFYFSNICFFQIYFSDICIPNMLFHYMLPLHFFNIYCKHTLQTNWITSAWQIYPANVCCQDRVRQIFHVCQRYDEQKNCIFSWYC